MCECECEGVGMCGVCVSLLCTIHSIVFPTACILSSYALTHTPHTLNSLTDGPPFGVPGVHDGTGRASPTPGDFPPPYRGLQRPSPPPSAGEYQELGPQRPHGRILGRQWTGRCGGGCDIIVCLAWALHVLLQ